MKLPSQRRFDRTSCFFQLYFVLVRKALIASVSWRLTVANCRTRRMPLQNRRFSWTQRDDDVGPAIKNGIIATGCGLHERCQACFPHTAQGVAWKRLTQPRGVSRGSLKSSIQLNRNVPIAVACARRSLSEFTGIWPDFTSRLGSHAFSPDRAQLVVHARNGSRLSKSTHSRL